MEIKVVGPIYNLTYNSHEKLSLGGGFFLCNDAELIKREFLKPDFALTVGRNTMEHLVHLPYILWEGEEELFTTQYKGGTSKDSLHNCWGLLLPFLFSLWFIKDNSININEIYLDLSFRNQVIQNKLNIWVSNSDGQYKQTEFTVEEFHQALEWREKIIKLSPRSSEENIQSKKEIQKTVGLEYKSNIIPYGEMNRLSRALQFVQVARNESFLPMKITAYVAALEALLSTSHNEVTHQISERVAKIMGGDLETRMANYNFIKRVYGLRSDYVHGSGIGNKTLMKMYELSPRLDSLVREFFTVLFEKHQDLFTKSENELKLWLLNLVLK
ncbi:HEPN domain-containing protein [Priestia megaterium]|uniref:HEPN domain-containing protein n=1 Tax=Priestia megaterium TaxID=1404 RepID=UPI001A9449A0|nr:HEPN domain-containing protein [Priestia megaterium]QSX19980.1 hypothetical protein J0P05_22495 [Priestia megaterium]